MTNYNKTKEVYYITGSQAQSKSMCHMKSINQHTDFSSSNSSFLYCWSVRLSSSILSIVKSPSIETERTTTHGDTSPRWIKRKSRKIHPPQMLFFFINFLSSFSQPHPPKFILISLSPNMFYYTPPTGDEARISNFPWK